MATLRCEECGYKLYEDDDECPKCGALVDDRPRSKKKSRDDDDDDDRPKTKTRVADDDDDDDRPKKKAASADFEILDDDDDDDDDDNRPKKKPLPAKKPPSADFDIEVDEDDEPAPNKPVKKGPPPPPRKVVADEPAPVKKPVVKKAPPPPPPVKEEAAPKPVAKKAPPPPPVDDGDVEPAPKPVTKKSPPPVDEDEAEESTPAKKAAPDADDYDDVRPAKKAKSRGDYEGLVVKRWTGVFTWTIIFGFFGPILLSVGLYLVHSSGIGKRVRLEAGILGVPTEVVEYRERDGMKLNLGMALAVVGGSAFVMAGLLFYLWLWRAWKLVPKDYGGMHPFVALLFLWVPLLNIVGVFLVIPGLSKAYKRMLEDLEPRRTPKTGVGVGMCGLIFALIPGLNLIAPFLMLAWFDQANFSKNRIEAIQDAARV